MIWIIEAVIVVLITIAMQDDKSEKAEAPAKPQWRDLSARRSILCF